MSIWISMFSNFACWKTIRGAECPFFVSFHPFIEHIAAYLGENWVITHLVMNFVKQQTT
jgi:hypothetical protein